MNSLNQIFSDLMEEGGINNMDPDSLSNLTLTESELLNLQQAGVLVTNSNSHFSQNDLDSLASMQVSFVLKQQIEHLIQY